jgi:ferric-dicitrate binding protein FerR (iron transport regulator)
VDSRQIQNKQGEEQAMNKLSIPYGKRSHITLADGSEIWVNSGSQLVYPSSFDGDKRKVYLKGEAFFQVHEDKSKPFVVKTSDLDIQVLGTRFNVNSYQENDQIETVLVDGKVRIEQRGIHVFDRDVVLKPSERASFSKETKSMNREKVDPRYYTSWKDGYLYLQNEDLGDIVQKLRRIYNRDIVLDDRLKSLTFSGKLDLRESLKKELTIISAAYPIRYSIGEEKITIEP